MTDKERITEQERQTEDAKTREELGPRGIPHGQDTAKMTPQRKKKTPASGEFDGHPA